MLQTSWFRRGLLLLILSACASLAHGGSISFKLALTGTRLALSNSGDSSAFFPSVLALADDGRWLPLAMADGRAAPTQLAPGAGMELLWPDPRPMEQLSALLRLRPAMVRFFDPAGVGFGQISFFTTPLEGGASLAAGYVDGALRLSPPEGGLITATWVLWPQEEGVAALRSGFKGELPQPPAQRVDWRGGPDVAAQFFTGPALPAVTLLHETAAGLRLQRVAAGWAGGRQQRSPWLDGQRLFYGLAIALAALAAAAALWSGWLRRGLGT